MGTFDGDGFGAGACGWTQKGAGFWQGNDKGGGVSNSYWIPVDDDDKYPKETGCGSWDFD